jgi:hypothetical protein
MNPDKRKAARPAVTSAVISREAMIESDVIPMILVIFRSRTITPMTAPKDWLAAKMANSPKKKGIDARRSISAVVRNIRKKRETKSFGLGETPLRRACLFKSP